jgi:hypothetical protein
MVGECNTYGGEERSIQCFGGVSERKSQLRKSRRRWVDNIKMDFKEVGCRGIDWIELAQDRDRWWALVNAVTKLQIPKTCGKFLE